MKLKKLIESLSSLAAFSGLDLEMEVTGITDDSRTIEPGMIFVAIKGYKFDGHNYIMDATKNGASLIIGEVPQVNLTNIPYVVVENTRKLLGQLSNRFYDNPSSKKIVIGVTGTNGKTTTCYLLKHLLEKMGYTTSLIGTIECIINGEITKSLNTTPSSLLIQQMMDHSTDQIIIVEVSSHGLVQYRLEGIQFDYALFTNLQHDHLDYHHTMEEYFEAKALLFDKLKPNGKAVINLDDEWGQKLINRLASKNIETISVGTNAVAKFRLVSIEGSSVEVEVNRSLSTIHSNLMGVHNMYNLSMASAIIVDLGFPIHELTNSLSDFAVVPGRFETVAVIDGVHYIIDYAHTDLALQQCLETIRKIKAKKIIHVFGFRGDRDKTKRIPMLNTSYRLSDMTLLTIDDLNEVPENEMEKTYQDLVKEANLTEHVKIIMDRTIAIQTAQKLAQSGDYVILTGKGPEPYKINFQMGTHSDKETILQLKHMQYE